MSEVAAAPTFEQQLARVAGYVSSLPRGPRAELRRLRQHADGIPPDIFWQVVDMHDLAPPEEDWWLAILPLMVTHKHQPGRRPGLALKQAGVKPARVERWLRYDRDRAIEEAHRLLAPLESGFDWVRMGKLLRWWDDRQRRELARDFFLGQAEGDEA